MYMEERQSEIAEKIEQQGRITTSEIVGTYKISNESARRDLRMLEERGLCKRTHGGAIKVALVGQKPPRERDMRTMERYPNYDAIAKAAAGLIRENETIFITSGAVGFLMIDYLPRDIHYTLVTNSPVMADMVKLWDNLDVYMVGGKMRMHGAASIVDALARNFLSQFNLDKAFLTGAGIDAEFGFTNGAVDTAECQKVIMAHSKSNILLMPNHKVGCKAFLKVCDADQFQLLITDWDCVEDEIDKLKELGLKVMVVPGERTC